MVALNEKETLIDLIIQEKEMMKVYGTFIPEGSTTAIRGMLTNNFKVIESEQFEIFDKMNKKGYYKIKDAQAQDKNQVIDSFKQG